jgi:hypothetical protein
MNEHILFVIDHLANPVKYTKEELEANRESAYTTWDATAATAANAATADAARAAAAAVANAAYAAAYWVGEYFKVTGENKQTYIDKLGGVSHE